MDIRGKLCSTNTVNSYLDLNKESRCILFLKTCIVFITFILHLQSPKILLLMNQAICDISSFQSAPSLIRLTESGYFEINLKEVLFLLQFMGIMFPDIIKQMR